MSKQADYDVIIAGGGPAGLCAGIILAGSGLHTLIIERQRLPVDKACGEGVLPYGVNILSRLGVTRFLHPEDYAPFSGIRYYSPQGVCAQSVFTKQQGWGIRRTALSRALAERAGELACLEIRDGTRLLGVKWETNRISARLQSEQISTRLLVGADGLHSQVRRWAGLQGRRSTLQRWGLRQHFEIAPWSDFVEVYWQDGLEAYITPCGKKQVGVAFLWDPRRHPEARVGKGMLPTMINAFPNLKEKLKDACACSTPMAAGPMHQIALAPVGNGVILIGDAAGYMDALTGEGISLAAQQALSLENSVAPLIREKNRLEKLFSPRELAPYQRACRQISRPYERLTRAALYLSRHPAWTEVVVKTLACYPGVFDYLLSRIGASKPNSK